MEGTVDALNDPPGLFGFVQVGSEMNYMFTFDTDAPNQGYPVGAGLYDGMEASLIVGGTEIVSGPPTMTIGPPRYFNVGSSLTGMSSSLYEGQVYFRLWDDQSLAIPDASLASLPYDLPLFEQRFFQITFSVASDPPAPYPEQVLIVGTIQRFYIVPEPGTAVLITWVLLAFTPRRRKRPCAER